MHIGRGGLRQVAFAAPPLESQVKCEVSKLKEDPNNMRLVQLFYAPGRVFAELEGASYVPALIGCLILSFLSNVAIISSVGPGNILYRAESMDRLRPNMSRPAMTVTIYSIKTVLTLIGLVVIATTLYLVLRLMNRGIRYSRVLAVCSYAAYAREAVRLLISLVAVSYCYLSHARLKNSIGINAAALFSGATTSRRTYYLLGCLDVLTLGFLIMVAIGLVNSVPNLRLRHSAGAVFASWVIYVGLGLLWGP